MRRYPTCMAGAMIGTAERMAPPGTSILLVEDDASLRRSLRDFLKDNGYQPHVAGTMREGWETIRAVNPAVCLLDLNLPDGSGLDLLKQIVDEGVAGRGVGMTAVSLGDLGPGYSRETPGGWLTKPGGPAALL